MQHLTIRDDLDKMKTASEKLKEITLLGVNQHENEVINEKRLEFDDKSSYEDVKKKIH